MQKSGFAWHLIQQASQNNSPHLSFRVLEDLMLAKAVEAV